MNDDRAKWAWRWQERKMGDPVAREILLHIPLSWSPQRENKSTYIFIYASGANDLDQWHCWI
jgi:hypothetical protein